jgi:uncharacterized protein (DUF983 family)
MHKPNQSEEADMNPPCFREYVTCIRRCLSCEYDMDEMHYPNNTDCPGYKPMVVMEFVVQKRKEVKEERKA